MVEAALQRVEKLLGDAPKKYDGDLPALYKRVSKRLHIGTDRLDIRSATCETSCAGSAA